MNLGGMMNDIGRVAGALSPIDLFTREQVGKLRSSSKGFRNFMQGLGDTITANVAGMRRNIEQVGQYADNGTFGSYMSGFKMGENRLNLDESTRAFRAMVRKRAMVGGGVFLGANLLLGQDNPIRRGVNAGATLGMHAGITAGLSKFVHPMAGVAYAGLGLYNMTRPGNNFGAY